MNIIKIPENIKIANKQEHIKESGPAGQQTRLASLTSKKSGVTWFMLMCGQHLFIPNFAKSHMMSKIPKDTMKCFITILAENTQS